MTARGAQYGEKGVTVNGFSPDYVETKIVPGLPKAIRDSIRASKPDDKLLTPEDVMPYIARLLDEDGDPVNGDNILIPCGRQLTI